MKLVRSNKVKKVKFCFAENCLVRKPQKGCANADETCTVKGCPMRKTSPLITLR